MSNIAIIPARGGSKRIPKKNIKDFLGKPIIAYAIETALNSKLFDKVIVSTDDVGIAEIGKKYGANVPFLRSENNSGDYATTYDVIDEVLAKMTEKYEYACCIYPCTPLLNKKMLNNAYQLMQGNSFDTVFPLIEYSHPIQRAYRIIDGKAVVLNPENALIRTQDLPKSYHDAGQFYFFNVDEVLRQKKIITDKVGSIIISEMEAQDIDNENDWRLAEMKFKLLHG